MKYINGREAKIGDVIACVGPDGKPQPGTLIALTPDEPTFNGKMVPHPINCQTVTLSDCLHIDDLGRPLEQINPNADQPI